MDKIAILFGRKIKVMMTIDQIVNSLEKLSKGTDFLFKISENKNE